MCDSKYFDDDCFIVQEFSFDVKARVKLDGRIKVEIDGCEPKDTPHTHTYQRIVAASNSMTLELRCHRDDEQLHLWVYDGVGAWKDMGHVGISC